MSFSNGDISLVGSNWTRSLIHEIPLLSSPESTYIPEDGRSVIEVPCDDNIKSQEAHCY